MSQEKIHLGLVAAPIALQPRNDVCVQPYSYWLLGGAMELSDFCPTPVQHFRHFRQINVGVLFGGDGGDLALLIFCELLHSVVSPCWLPLEPK
jgi:hypothetical protein